MSDATLAPIADRAAAPETLELPTGGLSWRPLTTDDAAVLHALVTQIEETDRHPFRTSAEETAEMLGVQWRDLATDSLVGIDADGVARAYGLTETRPGDSQVVRVFVQGGVHPEARGRGIGSDLLAWLTGRARQQLAASGKELPARIGAYVQDDAPAAEHRVFEKAGYAPIRYYSTLRRDLSAPVRRVDLDGGLRVVPWSPELDEATRLAHNDAFRDHWGSEPQTPQTWAHGRSTFAPQWSFVVVDDEAPSGGDGPLVAGYLISGKYEQDWPVVGYSSGYTETLGVRREYRGRRVAIALLAAAMQAYADDGIEYAELDVDTANPSGAHGLYASLGYDKTDGSRLYSIEL